MTFKTFSRIRSIGGSLVVTIPKEIVKEKGLNEGELIKIEIEKPVVEGFGALKGISRFTREDRAEDRV